MKKLLLLTLFCGMAALLWASYPQPNGILVKHRYYALSFQTERQQAEWVYYKITPLHVHGKAERASQFKADPKLGKLSPKPSDYAHSGYDRGHLCPAASMRLNDTAMKETFYMSNMSPQKPVFNRGIWKMLEEQEREWVLREDSVAVVCGPVWIQTIDSLPGSLIPVPSHYFKVLYDLSEPVKMIGFVIPNQKGAHALPGYAVSVDEVERLTGIDFFAELPDVLENRLEVAGDALQWHW